MAKKNQTQDQVTFSITELESEIQLFFEHLKRKAPTVFGFVTPEFISESLAELPDAHNAFNEKVKADAKAKAAAIAESTAENDRIEALRKQRAQKVIDDAKAKVEAEDRELQKAMEMAAVKEVETKQE